MCLIPNASLKILFLTKIMISGKYLSSRKSKSHVSECQLAFLKEKNRSGPADGGHSTYHFLGFDYFTSENIISPKNVISECETQQSIIL